MECLNIVLGGGRGGRGADLEAVFGNGGTPIMLVVSIVAVVDC